MLLKSLILTGSIQAFFLIILLKSKRNNSDSDKILILWLGIIAFQLLFYYDNLSIRPLVFDFLQLPGFSLPLISSPILYFYIYSLSYGSKFQWKRSWIHLSPYVFFNFVVFYYNIANPANITISYGFPHFSDELPVAIKYFSTIPLAIIPGYYTILSLAVLFKYQKLLPDNYSYTEKINLNWLKWIVISLLILFILLFSIIKFSVNYGLLTNQNLFAVVGGILSFYVFFIGYFGLRQTTIFTNIPVSTNLVEKINSHGNYKNSGINAETADQLFQKIKLYMKEEKPFLDENLSLNTLAQQLDLTPNQLSQVINQKSCDNFFNFINSYRVEAVKEKLKDPAFSHYSILAIAYDCGFRSKSSFNKIFKQMVGKTPLHYQKS